MHWPQRFQQQWFRSTSGCTIWFGCRVSSPHFSNINGVVESGDVQSELDNVSLAPNFSSNNGVVESGNVQSELNDDIPVVVICSLVIRCLCDGKKIWKIVTRTIPRHYWFCNRPIDITSNPSCTSDMVVTTPQPSIWSDSVPDSDKTIPLPTPMQRELDMHIEMQRWPYPKRFLP